MVVSYISHGHSTQSLSGFVLLCTTSDDQHCNAIWIELKCNSYLMELSSNILKGISISIQFNLTIGLRFNSKEMGCKFVERYWNFACNYVVGKKKKTLIRHGFEKTPKPILLGNGLNKFQFDTIQMITITYITLCLELGLIYFPNAFTRSHNPI